MNEFNGLGKMLIIVGIIFLITGIVILLLGKIPLLGRLPGDLSWKGKNWSIYFPIGTSILLSILLSIIFYIIKKINS